MTYISIMNIYMCTYVYLVATFYSVYTALLIVVRMYSCARDNGERAEF